MNQLNLYWEGVNHWHFVLGENVLQNFYDLIFQHLSVLHVLEHILLFYRRGGVTLLESDTLIMEETCWCNSLNLSTMYNISEKCALLVFTVYPKAFHSSLNCNTSCSVSLCRQQVSPLTLLYQQCHQRANKLLLEHMERNPNCWANLGSSYMLVNWSPCNKNWSITQIKHSPLGIYFIGLDICCSIVQIQKSNGALGYQVRQENLVAIKVQQKTPI